MHATTNQVIKKARQIAKRRNELVYVYILNSGEVEFLGVDDFEPKNCADFVVHPTGEVE